MIYEGWKKSSIYDEIGMYDRCYLDSIFQPQSRNTSKEACSREFGVTNISKHTGLLHLHTNFGVVVDDADAMNVHVVHALGVFSSQYTKLRHSF